MGDLLLDEPPMVVQRSLACRVGLDGGVILQQIHYWLQRDGRPDAAGCRWILRTIDELAAEFSFIPVRTLRRRLTELETAGFLVADQSKGFDRTKAYTVNYAALQQNSGQMEVAKLATWKRPDWTLPSGQNGHMSSTDLEHHHQQAPSGHSPEKTWCDWEPDKKDHARLHMAGVSYTAEQLAAFQLYLADLPEAPKKMLTTFRYWLQVEKQIDGKANARRNNKPGVADHNAQLAAEYLASLEAGE